MGGKRSEACGRCSMSTVVGVSTEERDGSPADPFDGGHIEVDESAVRAVSPSAWLEGVRRRVDAISTRLAYGK